MPNSRQTVSYLTARFREAGIRPDIRHGQNFLIDLNLLSILVTESSDSELVIDLINHAQIYRFLNKPINVRQMRGHVDAALAKYRSFKQRPGLVRSHAVTESVQARTSLWGAKLLDRIRGLPNRLFSRQA